MENNSVSLSRSAKFVDITSTGLVFYGVKWAGSDRFFEVMQMLIDIVDIIRQALDGELAPHKAERKVERTVVKYAEGRANCQRPERCSKKAI